MWWFPDSTRATSAAQDTVPGARPEWGPRLVRALSQGPHGAILQARGRELRRTPRVHQKQASVPPAVASALPAGRPIQMVGDCVELHQVRERPGSPRVHLQGTPTPLLGPRIGVL